MRKRISAFVANLINARVESILSKTPIDLHVQNAINEQVEAALLALEIPSIVRIQADRAIQDDCDVCQLVEDRVREINISDHIDYSDLAGSIDYDDLHSELDYDKLGGYIDYDDLAAEINYIDLGGHISCDDLAEAIKETLSFNVTIS